MIDYSHYHRNKLFTKGKSSAKPSPGLTHIALTRCPAITQQEGPPHQTDALGCPRLQNHKPTKLLLFTIYPVWVFCYSGEKNGQRRMVYIKPLLFCLFSCAWIMAVLPLDLQLPELALEASLHSASQGFRLG